MCVCVCVCVWGGGGSILPIYGVIEALKIQETKNQKMWPQNIQICFAVYETAQSCAE